MTNKAVIQKVRVDDIYASLEFSMDILELPGVDGDSLENDFIAPIPVVKPIKTDSQPIVQETLEKPEEEKSPDAEIAVAAVVFSPPEAPKNIPLPPPPPLPSFGIHNATTSTPKATLDDSAARSNLMAAIRGAGGKTAASADRAPEEENGKEKESSAGEIATEGGGGFRSDLRHRLSMRRRGISGNTDQELQPDNLMETISMMIPPPKMGENIKKKEQFDSDWD